MGKTVASITGVASAEQRTRMAPVGRTLSQMDKATQQNAALVDAQSADPEIGSGQDECVQASRPQGGQPLCMPSGAPALS